MNKTIFITCYHPFISRNIFNTDVLKILRSQKDIRIIILASPHKKDFLEKYYGGDNVIIESLDLDDAVRSKFNKFWRRLAFLLQNSYYVRDQRKEYLFHNKNLRGYINYFAVNFTAAILSSFKFTKNIYRFLDFKFSPKNILDELIKKYSPSLIFSTDVFSESYSFILRGAKARKIPLIGMVRSWDNTTTKGVLRIFPDATLVNNPLTKEELVRFHNYNAEKIYVVGLPQFDSWIKGPTLSRDAFFKKAGANPNKRLILFAPAGHILSDTDWQICQILKDGIKNGALPSDIQFLIRNHPSHSADLSKFTADDNFIIEIPGYKFKQRDRETEISPDNQEHLLNSVFYSDLIMYIATSLGLDATVFNKPQIVVSFDGWESKPYVKSVKRYHNEDNMRTLIELDGCRVVENKEDLLFWISQYLNDNQIDNEGRKKVVERHLFKVDGKAGERIANFILSRLN